MHISNSLYQLRTAAEFRDIETSVATKYDNVVVIIGDNVVPFTTPTGTRYAETTGASGRTRYIYIDTATTSIKSEDGVYKSLAVEQVFVHALAHAASDLGRDMSFGTNQNSPQELEAINRTNIVTQQAQLNGPRDTGHPQFMKNEPSPTFPGFKFSNGDEVVRGGVTFPDDVPTAPELARGGPVKRIEQGYNDEDETTEITFFGTDNSKTNVKIDPDNNEPWSSKTTFEDAEGNVRTVETISHSLGGQLTQFDPNNTHPYDKLEVTKAADGKVTAAQVTLDPNVLAAGLSIGQIFGSALGGALGGNSLAGNLAAGAIGGLIGQKFIQVLATSMTTDLSRISLNDVFAGQGISVANAGIGAVSSFLTAELGHALHIDGFDGQLFNTAASGFTTSLLIQVTAKMSRDSLTFAGAIAAIDWTQAVSGAIDAAQLNIGNLLGGYLGHELVPAQTREGAIGGQLFGAIGSFILPGGLGSLIGTILGTWLGNQFGTSPSPGAVDLLDQAGYLYGHSQYQSSDGGGYGVSNTMAQAAVTGIDQDAGTAFIWSLTNDGARRSDRSPSRSRRAMARSRVRGSGWRRVQGSTASMACIQKRFA
jgi:hypothetical protein